MLRFLFSNRLALVKIVPALFIVWYSSMLTKEVLNRKHLYFTKCLLEPEQCHNQGLYIPPSRVIEKGQDFFVIERGIFRIRIKSSRQVETGDYVSINGVFHKDGFVVPQQMHVHKNFVLKKVIQYGVSILVFIVLLVYFVRICGIKLSPLFYPRRDG